MEMRAFDDKAHLSFNVSVAEFTQPDRLVATITYALAESSFPPDRLCIEVTEGILIEDFEAVSGALRAIQDMGIKIALDDFGSGYSSLSYLAKLSQVIDSIKLDKTIVNDAMSNGTQEIIVRMVSEIAEGIGANVVAEGIEDENAAARMKRLGATHAQGYHFGRPDSILSLQKRRMAQADAASTMTAPPPPASRNVA